MNSVLKKRPPFPIETIATALAFSPRCKAIISEVNELSKKFNSKLLFIHVGEKTTEKEELLKKYCTELNIAESTYKISWKQGDIVDVILESCKENVVDLLVLGALQKEGLLTYYLGSVARKICRKAKCSVLLLTEPTLNANSFKKIVVNHTNSPKTQFTIDTALYWVNKQEQADIYLVQEIHLPALAMSMAENSTRPEATKIKNELLSDDIAEMNELCAKYSHDNIRVFAKTTNGKPGYAIANFAKLKKANLLVLNSPDKKLVFLDRLFTHDLEHVLAELPCNLLIVHSRV